MNLSNLTAIAFSFLFVLSPAFAGGNTKIEFLPPKDPSNVPFYEAVKSSEEIASVVSLVNEYFTFPQPLLISFGSLDGPLFAYGPDTNRIQIPYSFLNEVYERFETIDLEEFEITSEQATKDALLYTLFHELAHALIHNHQLVVLGKEEDAADSLASILLINIFEDGQDSAINAAVLFNLESEDSELSEENFWGEHSLDASRFYSTLCLVYGSDPISYAFIYEEFDFEESWKDRCIDNYENTLNNWIKTLTPIIKKPF